MRGVLPVSIEATDRNRRRRDDTGIIDGRMRKIVVRLGPETYSEAVRAHDERRTVKCMGDLVKDGRGYRLESARHFHILEADDVAYQS